MMIKNIELQVKALNLKFLSLLVFPTLFFYFILFNPFADNQMIGRMLAVLILMAGWWVFESVPMAITSLLPVFLFPLLGIMDGKDTSSQYFNDIIFLFIGGFIISLALEKWNLHKRIAYRTLLFFGTSPIKILLGFMFAASFLSMWMSNTATAMLMLPIATSVILELEKIQGSEQVRKYRVGLLLGIAYACSIGGIVTLIGTPPNLVFSALYKELYPAMPEVTFSQWMMFTIPIYILFLGIAVLLLYFLYRPAQKGKKVPRSYLENEYLKLGKLSREQKILFSLFVLFALSLIFKSNIKIGSFEIPGWSRLFNYSSLIKDGNIAIAVTFLLYLIPTKSNLSEKLMDWETTVKLPWGIILLFGGGFALAKGVDNSGLSTWIGQLIASQTGSDTVGLMSVCTLIMTVLTTFTSNVSSAQILLPVVSSIADSSLIHPLILMIPVTLASSLAFMMPVATPPNAIVFGSGMLKIKDMVIAGLILNVIGMIITVLITIFWGAIVFQYTV